MLHFPDSSTILPLLFSLMFFVCCWNGVSGIRGCQGVKYTHVKESPLIPRTPKAISCHIQMAPSELTVEAGRFCPDTGFNVGSVQTLEHTSEIKDAVISLTSLWRKEGKPPFAHDKACSTENDLPQAHSTRTFDGIQPYLKATASWKAAL